MVLVIVVVKEWISLRSLNEVLARIQNAFDVMFFIGVYSGIDNACHVTSDKIVMKETTI